MGNVAICAIESSVSLAEYVEAKHRKRLEHKRIRTLIPRFLARLAENDADLTTLDLNGIGIDTKILRLLCGLLLSGEARVQELHLQRNGISPEGATCIARLLSKDRTLRDVRLAHNPVGTMGAMAIASALEKNSTLQRLDLSYCSIDDDGIERIARSLKSNTTLRYLHLEGNFISSSGIHHLLKCVYDTSSFDSLWESNHTLRAFYSAAAASPLLPRMGILYSPTFPETPTNRQLMGQLGGVLATCNRRYSSPGAFGGCPSANAALANRSSKASAKVAACKILRHYVKGDNTLGYWECVEGMEDRMVPHVVGWLAQHGDVGTMYSVVRDMPWLLGDRKSASRKASDENESVVVDQLDLGRERVESVSPE